MQQKLIVLGRNRPHELLLLLLSILWGGVALFAPTPDGLVSRLPGWLTILAAGALLSSGTIGLVGCLWRTTVEVGLGLELGAMLIGAGGLLLSGYAVLRYGEGGGTVTAVFMSVWIVANMWRAMQIWNDLRTLRPRGG